MARISTPGGSSLPPGGTDGQVLVKAGTGTAWGTVAGGGGPVADATSTAKGVVQLAGDLAGTAAAPTVAKINGQAPATVATTGAYADLTGRPALAAVATTGAYADLSGKPTVPTVGAAGAGATVALSSTDGSTTNARTPTAHAASHATGGTDPLTPAAIGAAPAVEAVNTVAASGAAQTLPDPAVQSISRVTLTANCALTFPTATAGKSLTLVLVQDATGSRTVTWPGGVKWAGGTPPTLSTGAGKIDYLSFVCTDGANWAGFPAGLDMR